jgi:hypothetical protein
LYWIGERTSTIDQAVDERIVLKPMIKLSVFGAKWIILAEDRNLVMRSYEHGNESLDTMKGWQLFNKYSAPPIQPVHLPVTPGLCHSSGA